MLERDASRHAIVAEHRAAVVSMLDEAIREVFMDPGMAPPAVLAARDDYLDGVIDSGEFWAAIVGTGAFGHAAGRIELPVVDF